MTEAQGIKMVARTIKTIAIYGVTVLTAVTFLLHIFLPVSAPSLEGVRAERKINSDKIDKTKDSIISIAYTGSNILIKTLQMELVDLEEERSKLTNKYNLQKKKAFISGFPSWHKFLWHFGIGLVICVLSIYLLLTINMYEGVKRNAANFASMAAITISGYYMSWVFFPYDDLPHGLYISILVGLGVLSALSAFYLNKITFLTIIKLKSHIRYIMDQVIIYIPNYVKDEKKYDEEIVEPTLDKLNE